MKVLTIFYDPRCGLCAKVRTWLEAQPKRVRVEFLGYDSVAANGRFPGLAELGADREVVVLADDGPSWQGSVAWLTCLWATLQDCDRSFRLAAPVFQPFVRKVVYLLPEYRLTLSRLMNLRNDADLATAFQSLPDPGCDNQLCQI